MTLPSAAAVVFFIASLIDRFLSLFFFFFNTSNFHSLETSAEKEESANTTESAIFDYHEVGLSFPIGKS